MYRFLNRCTYTKYKRYRILPFRIDHNKAAQIMTSNKGIFQKNVKQDALDMHHRTKTYFEQFLPFYSANISNVYCSYNGQYGINRTETYYTTQYNAKTKTSEQVQRTRTVTDWYPTEGITDMIDYPQSNKNLQIYADFEYPRYLIEYTLTEANLDELQQETQKPKQLVSPRMRQKYAKQTIKQKLQAEQMDRAVKHIMSCHSFADTARIKGHVVYYRQKDFNLTLFYVPAYIWKAEDRNRPIYKVVNGYSGKYDGHTMLSNLKVALASSFVGMMSSTMYFDLFGIESLIGAISGGIIGSLLSETSNAYIHYSLQKQKKDMELNSKTAQQDLDESVQQSIQGESHQIQKQEKNLSEKIVQSKQHIQPRILPQRQDLINQPHQNQRKHTVVFNNEKISLPQEQSSNQQNQNPQIKSIFQNQYQIKINKESPISKTQTGIAQTQANSKYDSILIKVRDEDAKIMNLRQGKSYTYKQFKKAYESQLVKFSPDIYKGSRLIADMKIKQLQSIYTYVKKKHGIDD